MSDTGKEARTRTISWEDPHALAEAGRGLSGLEYLRKIVAGELPRPPIGALMNFNITEQSEGGRSLPSNPPSIITTRLVSFTED